MYPIGWFAIMTALCVVYAARTDQVWGPQKRFSIDWPHAISLALMVVVVGFIVAERDFNVSETNKSGSISSSSRTTTTTPGPYDPAKAKAAAAKKKEEEAAAVARDRAKRQSAIAFHAIGITFAVFAGLVLWRQELWYPYAAALAAMFLAVGYYWWAGIDALGNFVLVMVAVGFSLLGRITTKRGFIVAYVLLVMFDMYSIWGSDVMSRISTHYPGVFPKFLEVAGFGVWARGIGAGDVIFTAIACNHIHQHQGTVRAWVFAFLCTIGILIGILVPSQTPLLIFVSPIAILVLLFPKGLVRIE